MWKFILSFCIIYTSIQTSVSEPCSAWSFRTQNFFPLPLFETDEGLFQMKSEPFEIEDGKSIIMSCTGSFLQYYRVSYEDVNSATLTCRNGTFYSDWIPAEELLLKWVSCDQPPLLAENHTEKTCGEGNKGKIIEMYIKSNIHNDHYLYEVCFDDSIKQPLYAKYKSEKDKRNYYTNYGPKYMKGDRKLFSGVRIQEFFEEDHQKAIFKDVLGSIYWDYFRYYDKIDNVTLIENYYFQFDPSQRAIYNYANSIPIWNKIKEGSWKSSASSTFRLSREGDIIYYSGAWGVQTLKDTIGMPQEIRLEDTKSKRYPSPQWVYRVAYDEGSKKGIALAILNNPFATIEEAQEFGKIFPCSDACPNWDWINEATPKKGYVVCCDVNDFRKVVKDLPEFETVGLLP